MEDVLLFNLSQCGQLRKLLDEQQLVTAVIETPSSTQMRCCQRGQGTTLHRFG